MGNTVDQQAGVAENQNNADAGKPRQSKKRRLRGASIDYFVEYPWSQNVMSILSFWSRSHGFHFHHEFRMNSDVLQVIQRFSLNALIINAFQRITLKSDCIHEFSSVILRKKAILTVERWDPSTKSGGALYIKCHGVFVMEKDAIIDMEGKGYNGGREVNQGESHNGMSDDSDDNDEGNTTSQSTATSTSTSTGMEKQSCNKGGGGAGTVYSSIWCITGGGASHATRGKDGLCKTFSAADPKYHYQGLAGECYGPYAALARTDVQANVDTDDGNHNHTADGNANVNVDVDVDEEKEDEDEDEDDGETRMTNTYEGETEIEMEIETETTAGGECGSESDSKSESVDELRIEARQKQKSRRRRKRRWDAILADPKQWRRMCMGSGGGGAKFGTGGSGGGCLKIECEFFKSAGHIDADGLRGGGHAKLGGGGSGGSVIIVVHGRGSGADTDLSDQCALFDNEHGQISCVGGDSATYLGFGGEGGHGWIQIRVYKNKNRPENTMGGQALSSHAPRVNHSDLSIRCQCRRNNTRSSRDGNGNGNGNTQDGNQYCRFCHHKRQNESNRDFHELLTVTNTVKSIVVGEMTPKAHVTLIS